MDYNQNNNGQNYQNQNNYRQPAPPKKYNGLAIASMVCGICSTVLFCTGLSFPLGALGILFAILTRRKGKPMDSISFSGLVTSAIGLVAGIVMIISAFRSLPLMLEDPTYRQTLDTVYEQLYGQDFAEFWEYYYGIEIE